MFSKWEKLFFPEEEAATLILVPLKIYATKILRFFLKSRTAAIMEH